MPGANCTGASRRGPIMLDVKRMTVEGPSPPAMVDIRCSRSWSVSRVRQAASDAVSRSGPCPMMSCMASLTRS